MNSALSSAFGNVGVAPRQLATTKPECRSSACTFAIIRRPLSINSMSASFSPEPVGASQVRTAVVNHDLATPVVSFLLLDINEIVIGLG